MIVALDRIDFHILKKLVEDGRISYRAIAEETQLTDVAIKKRVESLKRKGVLAGIKAEINYDVLGFEKPVFVQIRSDLSKNKDLLKRIENFEHVMEVYQVLGEYNLLVKAVLPDMTAIKDFIERLGSLDGVLDIKTLVVLEQLQKKNTLPASIMQKRF